MYVYCDFKGNSLLVISFLNELELICLPTIKQFQLLLFNTNDSIITKINNFKCCFDL